MKGIAATKRKCKYTLTTKIHEKEQIHFTMKCMKMHEGKPGNAALRSGFKAFRLWRPTPRRWITPGGPPVAINGKQFFVCRGNLDSSRFPLASLFQNFF